MMRDIVRKLSRFELSAILRTIGFEYEYLDEEAQREVAAGKELMKLD